MRAYRKSSNRIGRKIEFKDTPRLVTDPFTFYVDSMGSAVNLEKCTNKLKAVIQPAVIMPSHSCRGAVPPFLTRICFPPAMYDSDPRPVSVLQYGPSTQKMRSNSLTTQGHYVVKRRQKIAPHTPPAPHPQHGTERCPQGCLRLKQKAQSTVTPEVYLAQREHNVTFLVALSCIVLPTTFPSPIPPPSTFTKSRSLFLARIVQNRTAAPNGPRRISPESVVE